MPNLEENIFQSYTESDMPPEPENPVVQTLELSSSHFIKSTPEGLKDEISAELITVPVYDETGLYLVQVGRCDLSKKTPMQLQAESVDNTVEKDTRPYLTMILMGGAASSADSNFSMLMNLRSAVYNYEHPEDGNEGTKFPYRLNVVVLPHMGSVIRKIDTIDPAKQENFEESSRILSEVLKAKELYVGKDVGMLGISAGGGQLTHLANKMEGIEKQCHFLALIDPAGMTENKKLGYEFSIGTIFSGYQKYHEQGLSVKEAAVQALAELGASVSDRKGYASNPAEMFRIFSGSSSVESNNNVASAWGLDRKDRAPITVPTNILAKDSTEKAREELDIPVIFSSFMYARVVNSLFDRIKENIPNEVTSIKDLKQKYEAGVSEKAEIDRAYEDILQSMFPNVPKDQLTLFMYPERTHSSYVNQKYWDNIVASIAHSNEH